MFNIWWLAGLVDGLEPHLPPISSQKNKMLIFGLRSTSDDWPGWSMDSNPVHHPSPVKKKLNACFWITFNFWWSAEVVEGLEPHLPPISSQKKWNAHFWIKFNFWWSARLVDGLEPRLPPLSSHKNQMLIFGLHSTSDDQPGWSMDSNPICHPSPVKKIKCSFLNYVPTSDDWLGWSMDSNPGCHPSPATTIKCSFFDYIQLLMIGWGGQWTRNPSTSPLQPKNKMLIFGLCSTSHDQPGWSMDSKPICHQSPTKK